MKLWEIHLISRTSQNLISHPLVLEILSLFHMLYLCMLETAYSCVLEFSFWDLGMELVDLYVSYTLHCGGIASVSLYSL